MSDIKEPHATHREVELLDTLRSEGGSARTARLAEMLNVSEETVRRTVKALAKAGRVERVHGGVYLSNTEALSPVGLRLETRTAEKLAIAREVARQIPSGSSVFLDVGSTTAFVAEALAAHKDLTIITNGLHAANALAAQGTHRVFFAGGELLPDIGGTVGKGAIEFVTQFSIDTAVFSIDGVDLNSGFLLTVSSEADLARAVAARAQRTIVACDSAKFGSRAPIVAFPTGCVDLVVSDQPLAPAFTTQFALWEVEAIIAP
ncbi:DeoR/GlpR family DNA-binding transcription regulator [Shimia aestuarii]|uniref:Transcriptional regulator, DeoR family n=1 Tax=Shimia aestuarii TaxID=254406 RepID=A0A1I4STU6_9RHOB|nr:DeoR/GlpR family DNA-binding transcription regulator [Shimia aestuarii]SFM67835.1 transcriptional regulator, DeoR family [Shimia aestuarii]